MRVRDPMVISHAAGYAQVHGVSTFHGEQSCELRGNLVRWVRKG